MSTVFKCKCGINELCRSNSLNPSLLPQILKFRLRGYNNAEIARKLQVHRITVQRYTATLRKMKESEFILLCDYFLREGLEGEE